MAGDWMKIELELPDKPEVHQIAGMLNIEPASVVGYLIKVWGWFNKHTVDGNAYGVTFSLVDRICGVSGFGEAMRFAGWLEQQDKTLVMPRFDRHTSESAKKRALTAKRVANHKSKTNADGNADGVSDALPKEEKRREDKDTKQTRGTRLPNDISLTAEWGNAALEIRQNWSNDDVITEFSAFVDYWKSVAGQKGVKLDWLATWRNWCRNSHRKGGIT